VQVKTDGLKRPSLQLPRRNSQGSWTLRHYSESVRRAKVVVWCLAIHFAADEGANHRTGALRLVLPRLYVILDAALIRQPALEIAGQLMDAGVRLLQYRAKTAAVRETLNVATQLAQLAHKKGAVFFANDRPDLAYLAGADGVHVGQDDLSVEQARAILGPDRRVGVSTHNREQFERALAASADYIAIGPIFSTTSKANPDPVVGTRLIHELRSLTTKPIVAIGGIRLERAAEVIQAGADSVAVISDVLGAPDPAQQARRFIEVLEAAKPAANLQG
jgi:thiamine-phosphate pyrophosphorylase